MHRTKPSIFLYKVLGNSMYPTIFNGDTILVERNLRHRIGIGDIALYWDGVTDEKKFIVHRIIWKKKEAFLTRGDNAQGCACVKNVDIVGKVRYIYRKNKETRCDSLSKSLYFVIRGLLLSSLSRLRPFLKRNRKVYPSG